MKRIFALLLLLNTLNVISQSNNQLWRSFFSYNSIKDISQSDSKVFAAAESAIFTKSTATEELKTITSIDGLKAETVTAIYHSSAFNKTLVGNQNGLILVVNADNSILNVVDIIEETTVQPNKKKINHFYEYQGKVYVGCDFGIAVFDLATMEFGDTYYLGPNGAEIPVMQTAILNSIIYTATATNGIRQAVLGNPNLNDYSQWTEYISGQWTAVESFQGQLFAAQGNTVYRLQAGSTIFFSSTPSDIVDLRTANSYLIATSKERVNVYNSQFAQAVQINPIPDEEVTFTCATVVTEKLFIGTNERGVFATPMIFLQFENITPDGPLRNNIFSMEKSTRELWAVYGGYDFNYVPNMTQYGLSRFREQQGWEDIEHEELKALNINSNGAEEPVYSLSDIVINPNNLKEVYVGSFQTGLVKITDGVPEAVYTPANTNGGSNEGLTSLVLPPPDQNYRSTRINGLAYDREGNLWMMNSRVEKPLKVLRGSNWDSYSIAEAFGNNFSSGEYGKMVIDKNGTKWIPTLTRGVIGFNEALGPKALAIDNETGDLPSENATCVAIDNNNQLWIGTNKGLRILSSVDRFTTEDQLVSRSIIIMEDGLAQELMYEQAITDIVVDGANNKWIATASAGAFLVSPNGQQTLFHFTKANSPLPSNAINDIVVDPENGEVFFATDKGMVSYQGTSTKAEDNLNNVYVFPNPVRPEYNGDVNISGLVDNANVKITDIEGNLVFETTSEGGTVLWNTSAFNRHRVASGVYMIFIASGDGTETKVKKVMIIR